MRNTYEILIAMVETLENARGSVDGRLRGERVSSCVAMLPHLSSSIGSLFVELSNEELLRARDGFQFAADWLAEGAEISSVVERGAGNIPLCVVKLSDEEREKAGAYLNAKVALGNSLWLLGDQKGAVECLWGVLGCDRLDVHETRFTLACWLFELGDDRPLKRLIRMCSRLTAEIGDYRNLDYFIFFLYLEALVTFRRYGVRRGGLKKFQLALYEPFQENGYVPDLLLGKVSLTEDFPVGRTYRNKEREALHCAQHSLRLWKLVPGALECLGAQWDEHKEGPKRVGMGRIRRRAPAEST